MGKRFHPSISESGSRKRAKVSSRKLVLNLMRMAGAEGDRGKWVRLLVENPISRKSADAMWVEGRRYAARRPPP